MYTITIIYLYNEAHNTCCIETNVFQDVLDKIHDMFHGRYQDYGPEDVTSIEVYHHPEDI